MKSSLITEGSQNRPLIAPVLHTRTHKKKDEILERGLPIN